jgi:hypothetical protein
MRVWPVEPVDIVPRGLKIARLDGEEAREGVGVMHGELQRDLPTHDLPP